MKLVPYLHFAGNAEEVLHFYAEALGGTATVVSRYGDGHMQVDEDYKNKILHSRLFFGDNTIMISDTFKEKEVSTNGNIQLSVDVFDGEEIDKVFIKLAEGGKVTMPLQDTFWGARFGMLEDKFGVKWMLNKELKK